VRVGRAHEAELGERGEDTFGMMPDSSQ
jgi:hypothetical protein